MREKSAPFGARPNFGDPDALEALRPARDGRGRGRVSASGRFVIRELERADLSEAAQVLAEGFPRHSLERWQDRLQILERRSAAPGTAAIGYGLDIDGLQGVGLTIGSLHGPVDARQTIVNGSSWTVRPAHRGVAAIELYRRSMSGEGLTFSNLSAGPHTLSAIKMCGFTEYTAGMMIGIGTARAKGSRRRILQLGEAERAGLSPERAAMMRYHKSRRCLTFCVDTNERLAPLMFIARPMRGGIRVAQLMYCEQIGDLVDNSRDVTLEIWKRGCAALLVDASGPIKGLKGRYYHNLDPKFYKGPRPFYAIDHSYSELIYFGL